MSKLVYRDDGTYYRNVDYDYGDVSEQPGW